MLTQDTVARAAAAAGIDVAARFVPVTGSTNSDLLALAAAGAPEWSVLVAGQQEAGRGRLGRAWVSTPGTSLLCSVLVRPAVRPEEAPLLSLAAGVALAEGCRRACGVPAGCKWPNDVVSGGRKLAGVLAEAAVAGGRLHHVVIGTGVNVAQLADDFPPELRETATSVVLEGGIPDAGALLQTYLQALRRLYGEGGRELGPTVVDAYRGRCESLGRRVRAEIATGETAEGVAVGVGAAGELLIETADGVRAVRFGEIIDLS